MTTRNELKFRETHEWIRVDGELATMGISAHAADELGDVVLVMLPNVGAVLSAGEAFGEIESLKAVSDLYAPVSGTIDSINDALNKSPQIVNDDAEDTGWLIRLRMSDPKQADDLMDRATYDEFLKGA